MKYYLKKTDGTKPERVFLYAHLANTQLRVGTKLKVDPQTWDKKLGACSNIEVQAILNNWRSKIENTIIDRIRLDIELTPDSVKEIVSSVVSDKPITEELTISYLFTEYMAGIEGEGLAKSTKKNYNNAYRLYEQFLLISKATDIVRRYTARDFKMFCDYLKKCDYADNSIKLYTKCVKKVLNKAYWNGLIENEVTRVMKFSAKRAVRENFVIFTTDELLDLETITIRPYSRFRIDVFLFLAYTGMRFSDYKRFVFETELCEVTDKHIIINESVKNKKRIFIPCKGFCEGAWRIMKKHNGILPKFKSVDSFNRGIQSDFERLEYVDFKKITSHCARKTFATAMLYEHGLSPQVVSKLLTHSDIKITSKYYDKSGDEQILKAMELAEKKPEVIGVVRKPEVVKELERPRVILRIV